MALEYLKVGIKRLFLKKNVCVARIVRKGKSIKNEVFNLSKPFNENSEKNKEYIAALEAAPVYYEYSFFGPIPVMYFNEDYSTPIEISKSNDGMRSGTLKALFENEKALLRAMFWAQASWLMGNPAMIGGILLLLAAFAGAFFSMNASSSSETCVKLIEGHINATASAASNPMPPVEVPQV